MKENRIFFEGNPWPEGHPIARFEWRAELVDDHVWFGFHLQTEDYCSERDFDDEEDQAYCSDWEAPIVWGNYHQGIISSSCWHDGGFPVCSRAEYSLEHLDGLELFVDSNPAMSNRDNFAFHIYLLGHDAVAHHRIKLVRHGNTDFFDIRWSGKIALASVGDHEFRHAFSAVIGSIKAPARPETPQGGVGAACPAGSTLGV